MSLTWNTHGSSAPTRRVRPGYVGPWTTARPGNARIARLGQSMSRWGRNAPLHHGLAIYAYTALIEWAGSHIMSGLLAWTNGLSLVEYCPIPLTVTHVAGGGNICIQGSAYPTGQPYSTLPQLIQGKQPGYRVNFYGGYPTVNGMRARSVTRWIKTGTVGARPFYSNARYGGFYWVNAGAAGAFPPGHVPWNVRPIPVWTGAGGITDGWPQGNDASNGERSRRRAPPLPQVIIDTRTGTRVVTRAVDRSVVSRPIRERKVGSKTWAARAFFLAMKAKEEYSEYMDLVEALYKALPKNRQFATNDRGKVWALWEHYREIDMELAIRNIIMNWVEDGIIGNTYFTGRAALRNAIFGGQMGSLGEHPEWFRQYAGLISQSVEHAFDQIWKVER